MMERVAGIEPACLAWKARALPLSYTRMTDYVQGAYTQNGEADFIKPVQAWDSRVLAKS